MERVLRRKILAAGKGEKKEYDVSGGGKEEKE